MRKNPGRCLSANSRTQERPGWLDFAKIQATCPKRILSLTCAWDLRLAEFGTRDSRPATVL
jgi:hypothetical protein